MKGYLTKHSRLCQFQVLSISGTWSILPKVQVRLCFVIPVPLLSHFLSPYYLSSFQTYHKLFSLSPYPFLEVFYTALRRYFLYHNLVFSYFSIDFFSTRLKDFILPVKFVTFIKSSFPFCFYLYSLL